MIILNVITHLHNPLPFFKIFCHYLLTTRSALSLFTNSDPLLHRASLTLHSATPAELAVAPLRPPVPLQVVAASAAQRATVVRGGAGPVALPADGARHVQGRITLAEVRRALIVEEVERQLLLGSVGVLAGEEVFQAGAGLLTAFLRFATGKEILY